MAHPALALLARSLGLAAVATALLSAPTHSSPAGDRGAPIVRVFLLAGQSNMEGHGVVDLDDPRDYNGGRGNLVRFLDTPEGRAEFGHLRANDGAFVTRDDVFVSYLTEGGTAKAGPLSVGYAVYDDAHHFGPELGLGHVLGERFAEPVLLVKTAWGGKSLAVDFRPPSAGGEVGPYYTRMLAEFRAALSDLGTAIPALAGHTPVLDGVVWFQGWNDGCDDAATAQYEANLVHLVHDVRAALGDTALPFVVGETGNMDNAALRAAQAAACARPEVGPAARFVPTRAFLRAPEDSPNTTHGHHWYGNGESYLRIGDALGRAATELVLAREVVVRDTAGLRAALAAAAPGQRIRLASGDYQGFSARGLRGAPGAPVWVGSEDPARPARFVGGVHLSSLAHVVLSDLELTGAAQNGFNLDDGGEYDRPSAHVVLRRLHVHDTGAEGNEDGIKLSGLVDFVLEGCIVERWGRGGSGVDMVGCHRGELRGCTLRDAEAAPASSGVQLKGGSSAIRIVDSRFEHAGQRALNLGGSTGLEYFRPPIRGVPEGGLAEARDVVVEGCTFVGSEAPVAFVGVDGASVRWNTFERPGKWLLRILQENTAPGFVPCRNGLFADNLVIYEAAALRVMVNIGPNTAAETFEFARNHWSSVDQPGRAAPSLPTTERDGTSGPELRGGAAAWPERR